MSASSTVGSAEQPSTLHTLRRGLELSPELRQGIGLTLLLAAVATLGRVIVPFSVQQTINTSAGGAGVLANYTALYNHKYNRVCANGVAACS